MSRRVSSLDLEQYIQQTRPYISVKHDSFKDMRKQCIFIDSVYGEWCAYASNVKRGSNHPLRANKTNSLKQRSDIKLIKAKIKEINPKLTLIDDTYTNTRKPCKVVHEDYGEWEVRLDNLFRHKYNHPALKTGHKTANEIKDWLLALGLSVKTDNRNWGFDARELDFIIEGKWAIEYCGLHWHTEDRLAKSWINPKLAHYAKYKRAEELGLQVFTIFEDEWLYKKEQVMGFLASKFTKAAIRVGARDLEVKEVPEQEANAFHLANHIQGKVKHSIKHFGLYNAAACLIAVMSFGKHHRGSQSALVLTRYSIATSVCVVGGGSRLLKQGLGLAKELNYTKLVSWSDNRWSDGNLYTKLGFNLAEELPPDYSYVLNKHRYSKQSLKKKAAEKLLDKTEKQLRKEQGYKRIWDCGKKRWELIL